MLATLQAVPTHTLVLPVSQIWVVIVGILTPLIGYVVNSKFWINMPEPFKGFIQALIAAIGGAITVAITTNVFGFNSATLQLIVTAIVAAFGAHAIIWKPTGVQAVLRNPSPPQ
jgi:uncharacterized membrane protein YeiH